MHAPDARNPDEWRASLVFELKRLSTGNRLPLTRDEASRLSSACDDWLFDNEPNMDPELALDLVIADRMVEKYMREIPAYGKAIDRALKAARDG